MEHLEVDREALYAQVWQTPISSLAKQYSISDVALAKICRRLHVPVPPRGYWARIASGQQITKPKLPKPPRGSAQTATIRPLRDRSLPVSHEVQHQKDFEADPRNLVSDDYFSLRLHPLIVRTKAFLEGSEQRVHPGDGIVDIGSLKTREIELIGS